jgi:hypothetical protein
MRTPEEVHATADQGNSVFRSSTVSLATVQGLSTQGQLTRAISSQANICQIKLIPFHALLYYTYRYYSIKDLNNKIVTSRGPAASPELGIDSRLLDFDNSDDIDEEQMGKTTKAKTFIGQVLCRLHILATHSASCEDAMMSMVPQTIIKKLKEMAAYLDGKESISGNRQRILDMRKYCVSNTKDWVNDEPLACEYSSSELDALAQLRDYVPPKNYRVQDSRSGLSHG